MRPRDLDEFVGQAHLLGPGRSLRAHDVASGVLPSLILWGPPGTGKTTLARILAARRQGALRRAVGGAGGRQGSARGGRRGARRGWPSTTSARCCSSTRSTASTRRSRTRSCRTSRRAPITLIGATTENPSFEVNAALLSRCKVVVLRGARARRSCAQLHRPRARRRRARARQAAARRRPTTCATSSRARPAATRGARCRRSRSRPRSREPRPDGRRARRRRRSSRRRCSSKTLLYDKAGEEHYNVICAFIKSMRGSDPDARGLLDGAHARGGRGSALHPAAHGDLRVARTSATPIRRRSSVAVAALRRGARCVGLPEGTLPMTQAVIYLATAPKSNTVLTTYAAARKAVAERGALPVPLHLRNAPTPLMKQLGYGARLQVPARLRGPLRRRGLPARRSSRARASTRRRSRATRRSSRRACARCAQQAGLPVDDDE